MPAINHYEGGVDVSPVAIVVKDMGSTSQSGFPSGSLFERRVFLATTLPRSRKTYYARLVRRSSPYPCKNQMPKDQNRSDQEVY